MERIGQADVTTILEKLHQELKAQTRDSKADQHRLLRKSFQYVTATLHKPLQVAQRSSAQGRKLSEVTHRVLQELFALLVGGEGFAPPRIRILSAALVRELSAGETPYFFRDNFGGNFAQYDQNKVKYFLPVLSELSNSKLLIQNISNLVGWFTGDTDNVALKTVALSSLIALVQRFPNVLDKDKHIRPMEAKFQQILTGASLETRKTTSTTLFGVRIVSTSSACNVTEVDGTPSRDFFTCMNNSYDYSEDQILNVHVFSSLYYWIFHLYQAQLLKARKKQSREDIVSKLEHFGLTHDTVMEPHDDDDSPLPQPTDEGQRMNPIGCITLDETFREVVISICLRILSQVERDIVVENVAQMRLSSKYVISELDWMREYTEATSMEAVRILDLLCLMDPALVSCIFPAVKKVYERTANRQSGLVFSAVLQFFVNHGQHVIFDVDPVLHHFFVDYVSVRYRQQLLAMSTLLFLTTNTSKMLLHTPVFPKYYPAIIKLLAWHPRTVSMEILPLVPAMVGPATFMELFHTLLDLPLTAAFMEQYDRPEEHAESQWSRLGLDRASAPFKTVQQYIMRNESGLGGVCIWETRDEAQLSIIRILWNSLPVTPRVSSVCKLVPRFLRVYFDVLLTNAPPSCIERVVPLLLQRFASLYPVDFFLNAVHSLIIDTLQAIFQQWPGFIMSLKSQVVQAISMHLDVQGRLLVLHLCWIIGELLSPAMCADCKGDITVFFEALEIIAYEAISVRAEDPAEKKRWRRGVAPGAGAKGDPEAPASAAAPLGADLAKSLADAGSAGVPEARGWLDAVDGHGPVGVGGREEHDGEPGSPPSGGGPGRDATEEDGPEGAVKSEHPGEMVFTPRFIAVIIASLTKLGTKFPEFSPRVILCLLKMRQHYETDFTEGIEFVRDRLTDSLQLLRNSAISNSVYSSQVLPSAEPDRFFSFHLSAMSSLSHISHNPSFFTQGALLHDFELPLQPPMALVARETISANTAEEERFRREASVAVAAAAATTSSSTSGPSGASTGPGYPGGRRTLADVAADVAAEAGAGRPPSTPAAQLLDPPLPSAAAATAAAGTAVTSASPASTSLPSAGSSPSAPLPGEWKQGQMATAAAASMVAGGSPSLVTGPPTTPAPALPAREPSEDRQSIDGAAIRTGGPNATAAVLPSSGDVPNQSVPPPESAAAVPAFPSVLPAAGSSGWPLTRTVASEGAVSTPALAPTGPREEDAGIPITVATPGPTAGGAKPGQIQDNPRARRSGNQDTPRTRRHQDGGAAGGGGAVARRSSERGAGQQSLASSSSEGGSPDSSSKKGGSSASMGINEGAASQSLDRRRPWVPTAPSPAAPGVSGTPLGKALDAATSGGFQERAASTSGSVPSSPFAAVRQSVPRGVSDGSGSQADPGGSGFLAGDSRPGSMPSQAFQSWLQTTSPGSNLMQQSSSAGTSPAEPLRDGPGAAGAPQQGFVAAPQQAVPSRAAAAVARGLEPIPAAATDTGAPVATAPAEASTVLSSTVPSAWSTAGGVAAVPASMEGTASSAGATAGAGTVGGGAAAVVAAGTPGAVQLWPGSGNLQEPAVLRSPRPEPRTLVLPGSPGGRVGSPQVPVPPRAASPPVPSVLPPAPEQLPGLAAEPGAGITGGAVTGLPDTLAAAVVSSGEVTASSALAREAGRSTPSSPQTLLKGAAQLVQPQPQQQQQTPTNVDSISDIWSAGYPATGPPPAPPAGAAVAAALGVTPAVAQKGAAVGGPPGVTDDGAGSGASLAVQPTVVDLPAAAASISPSEVNAVATSKDGRRSPDAGAQARDLL